MSAWIFFGLWCLLIYLTVSPPHKKKHHFSRQIDDPVRIQAFQRDIRSTVIGMCVASAVFLLGLFIVVPDVDGTMPVLVLYPLFVLVPGGWAIYLLFRLLVLLALRPRRATLPDKE